MSAFIDLFKTGTKGNHTNIKRQLRSNGWDSLLYALNKNDKESLNTNILWTKIKTTKINACERLILQITAFPRWFNAEIRHKLKCVGKIQKKFLIHQTCSCMPTQLCNNAKAELYNNDWLH